MFQSQLTRSCRPVAVVLGLALSILGAGAATAQEPSAPPDLEQVLDERMAELSVELELGESQHEPVREILENDLVARRDLLDDARRKGRGGLRELRSKLSDLDRTTEEALAEVLSPEQLEAFREWREAEREEARERFRERGGRRRP